MSDLNANDNICQNAFTNDTNTDEDSNELSTTTTKVLSGFNSALDKFRNEWKNELKQKTVTTVQQQNCPSAPLADKETLASNFYRKAVDLEQRGQVYDAMSFYRKAIQIEPNIEFKFNERQKLNNKQNISAENCNNGNYQEESCEIDLYEKFQLDIARDNHGKLIQSNYSAGIVTTQVHISDLPFELILNLLRWVVSSQLDMYALEQCAAVCKGLYLCARDEELWRLACTKVWKNEVGGLTIQYSSWRKMFIERERVHFNGCYISKTTYLRLGENSFQDRFYRPVLLVEYYRYIRFLPNGTVYMMTTSEEPILALSRLKNLQQLRSDILIGHYYLYNNCVTMVLHKQHQQEQPTTQTNYHLEFRIQSSSKRKFVQLVWLHYSIVQMRNNLKSTSEYDLNTSKYPPLWFSNVRSFYSNAERPLI